MATDWIAPFQHHTSEAVRLIGLLADGFEGVSGDDEKKEDMGSLVSRVGLVAAWARALPLDDEFWLYAGSSDFFHQMRIRHGDLLRDLFLSYGSSSALAAHSDAAHVMTVRDHLQATLHIMNDARKTAYTRSDTQWDSSLPHRCPPSVIVNELCLYTYSRELMRLPTSFQMQGWPLVTYDPSIHDFLHGMAVWLWNPDNTVSLQLAVRQTASFCVLMLTGAGFHIRPDIWHSVIDHDVSQIENLRSIGCEIDPLTWDEGQGEGVIVRLPWAPSEER